MERKKLLLLGGLRYLLPVIESAHEMGVEVITADYCPDNIAHRYSDAYFNIDISDKETVLDLAKKLKIDGIMSFAVDPGVITAAYVAEKFGLPFQGSYESVCILQNKDKFRKFLKDNGFNTPLGKGFSTFEDATKDIDEFRFPLIVKPVDSAGSKGVTRVDSKRELPSAIKTALNESKSGRFIIEEFIEPLGNPSDSDCFSINGKLELCSFSDQLFDSSAENPFTPAGYIWPSSMELRYQEEIKSELQRLITLLNLKTGIYNVETRIGRDGKSYIMEVSPRGGGNRLAEMWRIATGEDMIKAAIKAALNDKIERLKNREPKHLIELILHSQKEGHFKDLNLSSKIEDFIIEKDLWIKPGDYINKFNGANHAIGTVIIDIEKLEHETKNNITDIIDAYHIVVE